MLGFDLLDIFFCLVEDLFKMHLNHTFLISIVWVLFIIKFAENQLFARSAKYLNVKSNSKCNSSNYLMHFAQTNSLFSCAFNCISVPSCVTFNAPIDISSSECELMDTSYFECSSNSNLIDSAVHNFYERDFCHPNPCENDGICQSSHIDGITSVYCVGCSPDQGVFCE
ncbi:hypothetical protein CHUAL_003371 [Chamberlinius hualienensis]